MKTIKYITIVIAAFLTVLSTKAQEVSVNINPMRQILPPHITYYLSNPGQYFSISVQNNTQELQNIYFGVRLTQLSGSDNLEIYVPGSPYIPKTPMVLNPGQMKNLNAVEMRTMFNHVPFNAISMPQSLFDNALSNSFGLLPEGLYELTLHIYRWDPSTSAPQIINNPALSKCTFQVCYNATAPMWVNPFTHSGMNANYGALVYTVSAQSPIFQWMAPVVNCNPQARNYTYDFKIIEVPVGMDPNYLMEYGPTFYEIKSLTSPQCILPVNVTKYFCEGNTYAAQVTVHSNATQEGSLDFIKLENGGKSEIRLFQMTDFYESAVIKTHYTAPTIVKPEPTDGLNKLSMLSPLDPTIHWKAPVRSGDVSNSVNFKYNVHIVDFLSTYDISEEGMRAALRENESIVGAYSLTGSEFRIPDEDIKKFEPGKAYILEVVACPDTAAYAWKRFEFDNEGHSNPLVFTVSKSIVRPPQFTSPKPFTELDGEIGDKVETLYMGSPSIKWSPYSIDEGRLPDGVRVTYNVKIVAPTDEYPHTLKGMQDALDELEPVHYWGNMSDTNCDVPGRLFKEGDYNQLYLMQVEMKLVGPKDEIDKVLLSNDGKSKPALVRLSTGGRPTTYSTPVFLEPKPQTQLVKSRAELVELQYPMIRWEAPSMTGETAKAVDFTYDLKIVQPTEDYENTIEDVQKAVEELPAVYERKGISGTRFVLPHGVVEEIDTTKIHIMRVYAHPDTTTVGKDYIYDNRGRSVPTVVAFKNSGIAGRIEYSDTLNNFENPRLIEPAFLDDEGCRKKFINSDIAVSWRKSAYFGGFGAIDADSVKFTYDVEFYAADNYCSRSEMLEQQPAFKLSNLTELSDTIHWNDIKDKVVTNSYCMIRVVPHATNDTTTIFKNDSINVVDFALADLISRNYYNCQSRVKFTNKELTKKKAADLKGTTVKIGEYDLVLDGVIEDKAPGVFKGKGHVPWSPIGVAWKLEVQFDSLVVNTDNRAIAGLVETWGGPNNEMTSTEIVDNLFSDWGIDNLIGDANIPYAEQLQGEADKRVKGLAETLHIADYYNEVSRSLAKAENFLTGGPIGFPLQIPEKYNPSPVNLQITKMKFTPEYATMDLIGTFVIGETDVTENEILVFGAPRLCISPESLIPEGGTVALLKDFTVKDPKSDFDFTFKAPSDIVTPEDGCFLIWSGKDFAALSADFEMTLPKLKKVVEGKTTEENPKLRMQAKIKNWNDWTSKGHLESFEAEDAPGFTFGNTDVIIDYSTTENHPQCDSKVFEDYNWSKIGLEGKGINAWMGLYIPSIEMSLPESMSINGKDRIKMSISDMIIDKSGITMNAGFEDLINYSAGDNGTIGGFAFSMDQIYVSVLQNDFRKFAFDGKLQIPMFQGEILYDCDIAPLSVKDNDNNKKGFAYVFRTRQIENLNFDFMLGELNLDPALTYFLVEAYDKYTGDIKNETITNVELCVGGTVDIVGKDKIDDALKALPFDLHMPGIKFCGMRLANNPGWKSMYDDKGLQKERDERRDAMIKEVGDNWWNKDAKDLVFGEKTSTPVYLNFGQWGFASPDKSIGPFTFTLEKYDVDIDAGKDSAGLSFILGGTITLNESLNISGETTIAIKSKVTDVTDLSKISIAFDGVDFHDVAVKCSNGQFSLEGTLKVDDSSKKKGYSGSFDLELVEIFKCSASGGYYECTDEEGSFSSGYLAITCKELNFTPVKLYDIIGAFYFNSVRKSDVADNDYTSVPKRGATGIILGLGIKMGDGSTFDGGFSTTVMVTKGRLSTFKFNGNVKCAGIIDADVSVVYQNTEIEKSFELDITFDVSVDCGTGELLESVQGGLEKLKELNSKFEGYMGDVKQGLDKLKDANKSEGNTDGDYEANMKKADEMKSKDKNGGEQGGKSGSVEISIDIKVTMAKNGEALKNKEWHVYIGQPDFEKRCKFTLVNFKSSIVSVSIGADAYVCFGSELPNGGQLPPLPKKVSDFLDGGAHGAAVSDDISEVNNAQNKAKKKFAADMIKTGGGVMVGASVWGYIAFDLGLLYGDLGATAGFDMVLSKISEMAECVNLHYSPGFEGAGGRWYARGQLYAYLYAKFGLKIDLGFFKKKIDLVDCGVGGVFKCALPNPNYFTGKARIKIRLLGGLVNLNKKFSFECGDVCQLFMGNALDDFILFDHPTVGTNDYEAFEEACLKQEVSENKNEASEEENEFEYDPRIGMPAIVCNADINSDISVVDPTDLDKLQENSSISDDIALNSRASRKFRFSVVGDYAYVAGYPHLYLTRDVKTEYMQKVKIKYQNNKVFLCGFTPAPGQYYVVRLIGEAKEFRKGEYHDPETYDFDTHNYEEKPWTQVADFYFKTKKAPTKEEVANTEDLMPFAKIAFPCNITRTGPELISKVPISAPMMDMKTPIISLDDKYKGTLLNKGTLTWNVYAQSSDNGSQSSSISVPKRADMLTGGVAAGSSKSSPGKNNISGTSSINTKNVSSNQTSANLPRTLSDKISSPTLYVKTCSVPNLWIENDSVSILTPQEPLTFQAGSETYRIELKYEWTESKSEVGQSICFDYLESGEEVVVQRKAVQKIYDKYLPGQSPTSSGTSLVQQAGVKSGAGGLNKDFFLSNTFDSEGNNKNDNKPYKVPDGFHLEMTSEQTEGLIRWHVVVTRPETVTTSIPHSKTVYSQIVKPFDSEYSAEEYHGVNTLGRAPEYYGTPFRGTVMTRINKNVSFPDKSDRELLGGYETVEDLPLKNSFGEYIIVQEPSAYISYVGNMLFVGGYKVKHSGINLDVTTSESILFETPYGSMQGKLLSYVDAQSQHQILNGYKEVDDLIFLKETRFNKLGYHYPLYCNALDSLAQYMYGESIPADINNGVQSWHEMNVPTYMNNIININKMCQDLAEATGSYFSAYYVNATRTGKSTRRNWVKEFLRINPSYKVYEFTSGNNSDAFFQLRIPAYAPAIVWLGSADSGEVISSSVYADASGRHQRISHKPGDSGKNSYLARALFNWSTAKSNALNHIPVHYDAVKGIKHVTELRFRSYRCNAWDFNRKCWTSFNVQSVPAGKTNSFFNLETAKKKPFENYK